MALPKRFALSTLLLVMLLVSLVFGYAQWRRQWLTRQIEAMEGTGISVIKLSDSWFWPSVSSRAVVLFSQGNDGTYLIADKALNPDEAKVYYDSIRVRLRAIGVDDVSCGMLRVERNNEVVIGTFDFNEPDK